MPSYRKNATHRVNGPALYDALNVQRVANRMSWRQVAEEIGCAPSGSLFSRFKEGDVGIHSDFLISMLVWLGLTDHFAHLIVRNQGDDEQPEDGGTE